MTVAKKPAQQAPAPKAQTPEVAPSEQEDIPEAVVAPKTVKVKNISAKRIPLAKGILEPGKTGEMLFAEYSRLHMCLEKV